MLMIQKYKLETLVDKLGELKAQMAELKAHEEDLKAELISRGVDKAEGNLFKASVLRSTVNSVAYKSVIEALKPTPKLRQLLVDNTVTQERVQVRLSARNNN